MPRCTKLTPAVAAPLEESNVRVAPLASRSGSCRVAFTPPLAVALKPRNPPPRLGEAEEKRYDMAAAGLHRWKQVVLVLRDLQAPC
jgi:hypothetical protein